MGFQRYWSSAPLLARTAVVLAVLGVLVGIGTVTGVAVATPFARTLFLAVHLAVMASFLILWLRFAFFFVLHLRSARHTRQSWDPFSPRATWQIPWMRVGVVAASAVYFIIAVSAGDLDTAEEWSAPDIRSGAAGWTMLGAIIAVASGPLESAIADSRRLLREAAAALRPPTVGRQGDAT